MKKWEYMIVRALFNYDSKGPRGLENAKVLTINDKSLAEFHLFRFPTGGGNFFNFLKEVGENGWELINLADESGEGKTFIFKHELEDK